jgi:hypothetical protein
LSVTKQVEKHRREQDFENKQENKEKKLPPSSHARKRRIHAPVVML